VNDNKELKLTQLAVYLQGLAPYLPVPGCRMMKPEYLVICFIFALLIVVILAWRKFRAMDRRFERMQQEMNELRWMESRLFLMGVNASSSGVRSEAESKKRVEDASSSIGSTTLVPPPNPSK
jgi:hypothetical protein